MLAKVVPYFDQGKYDLAINGVPQEGTQGLQALVDEQWQVPKQVNLRSCI